MRKNQMKNRQKRKELNKLKAPVDRTRKKIESLNQSIKTNIFFVILFSFLSFLFFTSVLMDNSGRWKRSEITFQSLYYVPRTTGVGGVSFGAYYIITDDKNREWRITWDEDLDSDFFKADVKKGDKLTVSWYWWYVGRIVMSLESEGHSYRSFEQAEQDAKSGMTAETIFTVISALLLTITVKIMIANIAEKKKLKVELIEYQNNFIEYNNTEADKISDIESKCDK